MSNNMKKLPVYLLSIFAVSFLFAKKALAVCPICTIAVGAGVGLSRWLGIDDTITGIWIGGLILSSGLWMADWIEKKNWKISNKKILSVALFYLIIILPLKWGNMIGLPTNTLFGIDKLLLGVIIGSLVFVSSVSLDKFLRKINNQKVVFYYQKVIIPVFLLSISSFIFYLITN